jgi:uncharacterized protein (DUF1499 family)
MSRVARLGARAALGVTALAGLGVLGPGPGYRLGWWGLRVAFGLLWWGAMLALGAAALSLAVLLVSLVARAHRAAGLAVLSLVVALAVLAVPWRMQAAARRAPLIHDITTDPEDPPAFVAVLPRRTGATNPVAYGGPAVAAQQRAAYPDVVPLDLPAPPARVFPAVEAAARALGWTVVAADPAAGRLEATATTPWFGFKDDVVVRLRPHTGGTRVDVRSLSRIGGGDLGTNAARVRAFLARLRANGGAGAAG